MDVERTIEFILQQTAKHQAAIEALDGRINKLVTVSERLVDIQGQQADLLARLAEAQLETDEKLKAFTESLNRITAEANERQDRTDHAINALMDTVDRILPRLPKQ